MRNTNVNIKENTAYDEYFNNIRKKLSSYTEKFVNDDGTITYEVVETTYFLNNNKWNINFFKNIEQFKKQFEDSTLGNRNICFNFNNYYTELELKYIVYSNLFDDKWSIGTVFVGGRHSIIKFMDFLNQKYSKIYSLLDVEKNTFNIEWNNWLKHNNMKTSKEILDYSSNRNYVVKTDISRFSDVIYKCLFNLVDDTLEWDKDVWDIRNLTKFGISHVESSDGHLLNFGKINNVNIRKEIKRYFKSKLLSNNRFTFATAKKHLGILPTFINYILNMEPKWNDFKLLERIHIQKYIEYLKSYVYENSLSNDYIFKHVGIITIFLSNIQLMEYTIAPIKNVRILIYPEDRPKLKKKPYDQIDYIPNFVLDQVFNNIDKLHKDVVPILWIMFKTGLRISDTLCLKQDCLVKENGTYWIKININKTYVKNHKIPIDNQLANVLEIIIEYSKENSNRDNNPSNYIFVRYNGSRKCKPYTGAFVSRKINIFARQNNIIEENGTIFHFKNHAFRHTYAVKLLNNGVDILIIQELLAHASPEMTLRYAKFVDNTKRKAFDNAVKQGIFSFTKNNELVLEDTKNISKETLDMLWLNHKLEAVNTSYGTCLQRKTGSCTFAKQPPCLTCNNGNPCNNLCVGAFDGDIEKYKILIDSTNALIKIGTESNRIDIVDENKDLLKLYTNIFNSISEGNIVYGNISRLKKEGKTNG